MNPKPSHEVTVETLIALRKEDHAVRLITDQLRVKEMGPADHIRTKHEVNAFVKSGAETEAEILIQRATQRRILGQKLSHDIAQRQRQSL